MAAQNWEEAEAGKRAEEGKHLLEALPDEVFDPQGSCRSRGLALGYVAFDVFAEDVGFEVDGVARVLGREIGHLPCFWDDGDVEMIF